MVPCLYILSDLFPLDRRLQRNRPILKVGRISSSRKEEFINSHSGHTQRQSRRLVADPIQSGPALGPSCHSPARIARLGRLVARPTSLARNRRWRRTQPLPYQSPRLPLSPLHAPRSRPQVYCVRVCPGSRNDDGACPHHREIRAAPLVPAGNSPGVPTAC